MSQTEQGQAQRKPRGKLPSLSPEQRTQARRARFVSRVPKRVNMIVDSMAKLEKLGNRAHYSYSDEEAAKVVGALSDALRDVQDAFSQKSSGKSSFAL